jgi:DNA-binding NarL/FixJ family response regulator
MPIRVVLVDDHPLVLNGLQQLLQSSPDFEVVGTGGSAEEGLAAVERLKPDVLVLDLKLPGDDGLSVLRRLNTDRPPRVVVLTASQDEDELLDAARLGAKGIVLKAMAPRMLEDSIRAVHRGELSLNVAGVDLGERLSQRQQVESELSQTLTPRELEIVRLVALHLDNQELAERLAISVGTVKIHLHHIYEKLNVRGRHELQVYLRERAY